MPGLRTLAEADLAFIVEDDVAGFGWPIVLTSPADVDTSLVAITTNTLDMSDPDTGTGVAVRRNSVTVRTSSLPGTGPADYPVAVADGASKPWRVTYSDLRGNSHIYRVRDTEPDDTLGVIVLHLEPWSP